ncbi:Hypothetical predicted protein [Mytilus galloprovincialis]|uniref:C2H2-type domain-containing protein n=1 Tax=Mytilus galloprovincialis TaxID=29158 RepID=A0A8B6C534_MYTGA|nr:Hypothetical predicted protein [Mytilus galloprovincialis]
MDEFYLFVNSGDSLQLFPQNRGGQFRIRLPRSHLMKGTWECALLEMTFVPAFETSTQRMYVCCDLVRDESYVRDTYLPLLQSVAIRKEETTEIIFERPLYLASRGGEMEILEITLRDDRLRVCAVAKMITCSACFISDKSYKRESSTLEVRMECPSCQRMFSRRDVMLRHHRNKHGTGVPPATPPPPPPRRHRKMRRKKVFVFNTRSP